MRKTTWAAVAALAMACAGPVLAVEGTFVLEDGSYSITVEEADGNLVVVEPNKRSVYTPDGSGRYTFHNDNTGSDFYLSVLDDNTLEAGRIPQSGSPSILRKVDVAGAMAALESNDEYGAIAERYAGLAESDPANAQAWSFCAAVAFKRAMSSDAEFGAYASQTAQVMQQILVGTGNPCPDAIPAQYW